MVFFLYIAFIHSEGEKKGKDTFFNHEKSYPVLANINQYL